MGVSFRLNIKGTTLTKQPRFVDAGERWKVKYETREHLKIEGGFTSPDGRNGYVEIECDNGKAVNKSFWLGGKDASLLVLEQVVNPDGEVFNAKMLKVNNFNEVKIPGTNTLRPRIIKCK